MTRVVLDGLPLVVRSAGVATYTRELARHLCEAAPAGMSLAVFAPAGRTKGHKGLQGLQGRKGRVEALRSWLYPVVMGVPAPWVQGFISLEAAVGSVDVFHGTTYALPARARAALVATVHDLALLRAPELGNRRTNAMVRGAAASFGRADRLIAVSRSARDDLVELCGVDAERIDVVHNGCAPAPALDRDAARAEVARRLGIAGPYVLHVGTHEPRKNLPALIRAFARLCREAGIRHRLVLAGAPGWEPLSLPAVAADAGVADRVALPGSVAPELLDALYAAADLFVFPSLYEGFGLPVLEAMARGVPVVTSSTSAMPEVAGDAAVLVDPRSENELVAAMRSCLEHGDRAARLRAAGLARARGFTWNAAAQRTLDTYQRALDRR